MSFFVFALLLEEQPRKRYELVSCSFKIKTAKGDLGNAMFTNSQTHKPRLPRTQNVVGANPINRLLLFQSKHAQATTYLSQCSPTKLVEGITRQRTQ